MTSRWSFLFQCALAPSRAPTLDLRTVLRVAGRHGYASLRAAGTGVPRVRLLARAQAFASTLAARGMGQASEAEAAWGARLAACAAGGDHPLVLLVLNYRLPRATAALWHRGARHAQGVAACSADAPRACHDVAPAVASSARLSRTTGVCRLPRSAALRRGQSLPAALTSPSHTRRCTSAEPH